MPTFQFFVGGQMVDEMKGADAASLENKVKQHQVVQADSFGGKSNTLRYVRLLSVLELAKKTPSSRQKHDRHCY
jgi:hypothetical protein